MKIGLLSDTHNHVANLKLALAIFHQEGIETLIHCGDMTSPETAVHLAGFRIIFVNGNMDGFGNDIHQTLITLNPENSVGPHFTGVLVGTKIAVAHGHIPGQLESFIQDGFTYIFHGHTHRRRDEQVGQTRIINPGALGGTQHELRSICKLDLQSDHVQFIDIHDP
jgi:putative phosphoesterase